MAKQQHLSVSFTKMLDAALDTPLSINNHDDSSQKPPSRQQSQNKGGQDDARPDSATIGPSENEEGGGSSEAKPSALAIVLPAVGHVEEGHKGGSGRSIRRSCNRSIISRRSSPNVKPTYVAYHASQPNGVADSPDEKNNGVPSPKAIPTASSVYSPEALGDVEWEDNRHSIRRSFNGSILIDISPEFGSPRYIAYRGSESGKTTILSREEATDNKSCSSGPTTSLGKEGTSRVTSHHGAISNPFSDDVLYTRSVRTISRNSLASSTSPVVDFLPPGENRLRYGMRRLWETSTYTDISILCGDYIFPVHRCILSSQCAYFKRACSDPFPSRNGLALDMSSEGPDALRCMLGYFYTGELDVPTENYFICGGPAIPSLAVLRKVYRLATKYDLSDMRALALKHYCAVATTKRQKGNALLLVKALTELFGEGAEDLDQLRSATIETVIRHSQEVLTDPVACDQLQGEPLRALALEMGRQLGKADRGEGVNCCEPRKWSDSSSNPQL